MTKSENRSAGNRARDEQLTETATTWFVRITSGVASGEERRHFRTWLDADPAHREAYAQAEALWVELAALPDPRPSRQGSRRRVVMWRGALLAASLLLAVACGLWGAGGYDRLRADYATGVGEMRQVTLADGSLVHLNTDTALAVEFGEQRRVVRLFRGEAFFAVAANKQRPFEVVSDGIVARAVGTAYAVQNEASVMTVAVAEGQVAVEPPPGKAASGRTVTLGPGDVLRYAADGEAVRFTADVDAVTAWRQGKLVFANRPLRSVVAELDRYRPGRIVLLSSAIADERFSGVVSLADTDRALAAIESTLPVEILHITAYLTLLREKP